MDPITREEQFMAAAGGKAVDLPTPITREEMYLAKAAGLNVTIPEPITRREKFLSKISANSGGGDTGGGDTPSGNFKKKFMSVIRVKKASSFDNYDFVVTLCSVLVSNNGGGVVYDEEILPTKTYDGIKVSGAESLHLYFIEDENDIFVYGDMMGTGTAEWLPMSIMLGTEFGGVITDLNQLTPNVAYVLFYYVEAESE